MPLRVRRSEWHAGCSSLGTKAVDKGAQPGSATLRFRAPNPGPRATRAREWKRPDMRRLAILGLGSVLFGWFGIALSPRALMGQEEGRRGVATGIIVGTAASPASMTGVCAGGSYIIVDGSMHLVEDMEGDSNRDFLLGCAVWGALYGFVPALTSGYGLSHPDRATKRAVHPAGRESERCVRGLSVDRQYECWRVRTIQRYRNRQPDRNYACLQRQYRLPDRFPTASTRVGRGANSLYSLELSGAARAAH